MLEPTLIESFSSGHKTYLIRRFLNDANDIMLIQGVTEFRGREVIKKQFESTVPDIALTQPYSSWVNVMFAPSELTPRRCFELVKQKKRLGLVVSAKEYHQNQAWYDALPLESDEVFVRTGQEATRFRVYTRRGTLGDYFSLELLMMAKDVIKTLTDSEGGHYGYLWHGIDTDVWEQLRHLKLTDIFKSRQDLSDLYNHDYLLRHLWLARALVLGHPLIVALAQGMYYPPQQKIYHH